MSNSLIFNSVGFLIFFPAVAALYFIIRHKYRWILLLISSYYFYMSWKPEYIILIAVSTLVSYISAINISNSKAKKKIFFLCLSIFTNIGLLFAFKYLNFFSNSVRELFKTFSIPFSPITLKILLPVGLSFYTFQALGYTIDVYNGKIKPEKHLGIFALFISYFPQLVAGPIERAKNFIPQFHQKQYFDYKRATDGLKLML